MLNWLPIVSLGVSLAAFAVSAVASWKTHFASFRPLTTVGDLTLNCYPIKYDSGMWCIMSFTTPIAILNAGAQPGIIEGMRLRLEYPMAPQTPNCEYVPATFVLDTNKAAHIGFSRRKMLRDVVIGHPMPFPILPKATVLHHVAFETRWDTPVVQERAEAILEIMTNAEWSPVSAWKSVSLDRSFTWPQLIHGSSFSFGAVKNALRESGSMPPNLHEHIAASPDEFADLLNSRVEREDSFDKQELSHTIDAAKGET